MAFISKIIKNRVTGVRGSEILSSDGRTEGMDGEFRNIANISEFLETQLLKSSIVGPLSHRFSVDVQVF